MPELFRLQNNSGIQNTKNTKQKLILLVCNAYNCNKKNTYRKRIIPIARMRFYIPQECQQRCNHAGCHRYKRH